jgi:phosphopentomutase
MTTPLLRRAVVVVMDSCGVGAAPDAVDYGDEGTDTLGHTAQAVAGLQLPVLQAAGLGNLHGDLLGVPSVDRPTMAFGKLTEASAGKDSTTGHWEIAGVITHQPMATFTETGFPQELVSAVEREAGVQFIGNYAASGTVIIEELGEEHLRTGRPILYTSADSVFQIAAHKDVIPLEDLYRICRVARQHCDAYRIGRVIARPFEGEPGSFRRTYERQDFAMPPSAPTILDRAAAAGIDTFGVGKIEDLFAGRGLVGAVHTEGDADGLQRTAEAMESRPSPGIIFTNLVDLDMLYGHREDPVGYHQGLRVIDSKLPLLLERLGPQDLLVLCADHGNDPTDGSTDHTREYVPLLVAGLGAAGVDLGVRAQYCDVAATLAEGFRLEGPTRGASFLGAIT